MEERRREPIKVIKTKWWVIILSFACFLYCVSLYLELLKNQSKLLGEVQTIKENSQQRRIFLEKMQSEIILNATQIEDLKKTFALMAGLKTTTITLKSIEIQ